MAASSLVLPVLGGENGLTAGLARLWRTGQLCDVHLRTDDGQLLPAHRACLVATSGYMRAVFLGAGTHMMASTAGAPGEPGEPCSHHQAGAAQGATNTPPLAVVSVPDVDMEDVYTVVSAIYDGFVRVSAENLERLLRLASFLEMHALLEACTEYMRQVLTTSTAVPLLVLASRYGCLQLRSELVQYMCGKFSRLSLPLPLQPATPEADDGGDGASPAWAPHARQLGVPPPTSQHPYHHPVPLWPLSSSGPGGAAASLATSLSGAPAGTSPAPWAGEATAVRHVAGSWPHAQHAWHGPGSSGGTAGDPTLERVQQGLLRHAKLRRQRPPGGADAPSPPLPAPSRQPPLLAPGAALGCSGAKGGNPLAWQQRHSLQVDDLLMREDAGCVGGKGEVAGDEAGEPPTPLSSPLCALPKDLLLEVLHSDELTVDCEMDVLQVVIDWVAAEDGAPGGGLDLSAAAEGRMRDLPELLQAVRAEQVPVSLPLALGTSSARHAQIVAVAQELLVRQRAGAGGAAGGGGGTGAGGRGSEVGSACGPRGVSAGSTPVRGLCSPPSGGTIAIRPPALPAASPRATPAEGVLAPLAAGAGTSSVPAGRHAAAAAGTGAALPEPALTGAPAPARQAAHSSHYQQQHRHLSVAFGRPRRYQPTGLVAAGGHDGSWRSLKLVERYDPSSNTWALGPAMSHSVSFAAGALLDREVLVVGGTPLWSYVSRLVGAGAHWEPCPNMPHPRAHAGVAAQAGLFFVLGGRSQVQTTQQVLSSVEVFSDGAWAPAAPMSTPRSALAAAAVRGGIFAIGGQTSKLALRTVERFDLGSESWSGLAGGLSQERKYASAAVLGGRIYLVGGLDEMRTRQSWVEALDPREGKWQLLAPLSTPRSSAGLAALQIGAHGRIWAVGGTGPGDVVLNSVEMYEPEAGRWVPAAPMGVARSGLALAAG